MTYAIHRSGLDGKPRCGAEAGRISVSGIRQFLTCPACLELTRPRTREEQLAALKAQLDALHAKKQVPA